ncbi:MAG: carbon monoxide dehydrogenase [Methanomassiliicoccus sp.]|nr:carbon monoxide dehydrogenase [Methanomassiliicoccus sp.]
MELMSAGCEMSGQNRWDHVQARVGYRRGEHRVAPGLYRFGQPSRASPVLASANYTLSFDALRTSLRGIDAYILVLDTKGINVWCAAGKGTFGTEEMVSRIRDTSLAEVVDHRRIVLPQLGAPGVAAHQVKKETGFTVEYGPVRAADIPEYLRLGHATEEMRRVNFPLKDRAVLTPVEVVQSLKYLLPAMVLLFLVGGIGGAMIAVAAVLGGAVLFPLLLPYLPTREFSSKGLILGAALSLPFSYQHAVGSALPLWTVALFALALAMMMAAVVGYIGLNFTGCSTYASRTGVRKEIFRWMPVMVGMLIVGAVLMIVTLGFGEGWF